MGSLFKNKFFIITLSAAVLITAASMVLKFTGRGAIISDAVNIIITPFERFADIIKSSSSGFFAYFTEFNTLKKENEELKDQLKALEIEVGNERILKEKNDMLMSFFDLKSEHLDYVMQDARVIANDTNNYTSTITIDKGSFHEIAKDMTVICKDGMVGYVSEVGIMSSKVTLFIRTSNSISAKVKKSGEPSCIIDGDFELEKKGLALLSFLPKDEVVEAGDMVYTSGSGGIYPEGLLIGVVEEVMTDQLLQSCIAYIKPAADLHKISDVMIIKSFERSFY